MALKYAVASGDWSSTATWSDTDGGVAGASPPAAGDAVFISAGVDVLMDTDLSSTALGNVTVRGGDTPGMIYFKDGTNGVLNCAALAGTTGAYRGRVLANSDGLWAGTTPLSPSYQAIIMATSINGSYLEMRLYCTEPTNKIAHLYGRKITVTVSPSEDTFTAVAHGLSANTALLFRIEGSGTLPSPLVEDAVYHAVNITTDTFQVAAYANGAVIDITSAGSGTIVVLTGGSTGTTFNVLEDLTSDAAWAEGAGVYVSGVNRSGTWGSYCASCSTISELTSSSITFDSSITSASAPPVIAVLRSRNVAVRCSLSGVSMSFITGLNYSVLNCEISNSYGTTPTGGRCFNMGRYECTYGGVISGFYAVFFGSSDGSTSLLTGIITGCRTVVHRGTIKTSITAFIIGCEKAFDGAVYLDKDNPCRGTIHGCISGISKNTDFNGTIRGCYRGVYGGTSDCIIKGLIHTCTYGVDGSGVSVSASIRGCSAGLNNYNGLSESNIEYCSTGAGVTNTIFSGAIENCNVGLKLESSDLAPGGVVKKCATGIELLGDGNMIYGEVSDCTYDFKVSNGITIARNALISTSPVISSVMPNARLYCENLGRVSGTHKAFFSSGSITKLACDGTGTAPSTGPNSQSGDCIACGNIASNISFNPLPVLEEFPIWLTAGTYTLSIPIQTTYAGIAKGGMLLKAAYIGTGNKITEASSDTAISQRSSATDWSQGLSITITTTQDGWARLFLQLTAYELNGEVFIWPIPEIS